jgi:hypothetical protein
MPALSDVELHDECPMGLHACTAGYTAWCPPSPLSATLLRTVLTCETTMVAGCSPHLPIRALPLRLRLTLSHRTWSSLPWRRLIGLRVTWQPTPLTDLLEECCQSMHSSLFSTSLPFRCCVFL